MKRSSIALLVLVLGAAIGIWIRNIRVLPERVLSVSSPSEVSSTVVSTRPDDTAVAPRKYEVASTDIEEPATLPVQVAESLEGPRELRTAAQDWIAEEQDLVGKIANESFAESVAESGVFATNYAKVIGNAEIMPQIPESLHRIVLSRRFAKLVEQLRGPEGNRNREMLHAQLAVDLDQWRRLYEAGQRLYGATVPLDRAGVSTTELIVPLTYRVNSVLLTLGQEARTSTLSAGLAYADTLKDDANWALAGFVISQSFDSLSTEGLNDAQRSILRDYAQIKNDARLTKLVVGRRVTLPSYQSPVRPGDRTAVMGAPVAKTNYPGLTVTVPPRYRATLKGSQADISTGRYNDPQGGTKANQKIVELGRQFVSLSK